MKLRFPDTSKVFERSLEVIVNVLILYIIAILALGLFKTLSGIRALVEAPDLGKGFSEAVTGLLTFLVIIELFKGFVDYFKAKRFSLRSMLDPAILFVIRELIVSLYHDEVEWMRLIAFSVLILSLGLTRALAVRYSPAGQE